MEVIILLILASLALAGLFLAIFVWATRSGQFEDTTTPALRILTDDLPPGPAGVATAAEPAAVSPDPSLKTQTQTHP